MTLDENDIRSINDALQSDILESQAEGNALLSRLRIIKDELCHAEPMNPVE